MAGGLMPKFRIISALTAMLAVFFLACKSKVHSLDSPPDPKNMIEPRGLELTDTDRKGLAIALKRDIELYL